MRLLCDENIVGLEAVRAACDVRTAPGRHIEREMLSDIDALWVRSVTRVDRGLLAGTPVRFVGTATAGYEHIDLDYLADAGVAFAAAPGANANAVAEYVLAALAELGAPWQRLDAGARLAIVGAGHVGQRLARVAVDLGWECLFCDPWVAEGSDRAPVAGARWASFDEVLQCEVLSLHCSLHAQQPWPSRHLLEAAALSRLGAGQWLINAARGAVVDNAALLARLQQPAPPEVVLDVWEAEPHFDPRLLAQPALRIGTPHIAGYSVDAKWAATRMLAAATPGLETLAIEMPPAPALALPADRERLPLARALLRGSVSLRRDDTALRAVARLGDTERGSGFDRLRRDYPPRRELRGRILEAGSDCIAGQAEVAVMRALGLVDAPGRR
jgi:erythronate-4-phosphate dehydrogenase